MTDASEVAFRKACSPIEVTESGKYKACKAEADTKEVLPMPTTEFGITAVPLQLEFVVTTLLTIVNVPEFEQFTNVLAWAGIELKAVRDRVIAARLARGRFIKSSRSSFGF